MYVYKYAFLNVKVFPLVLQYTIIKLEVIGEQIVVKEHPPYYHKKQLTLLTFYAWRVLVNVSTVPLYNQLYDLVQKCPLYREMFLCIFCCKSWHIGIKWYLVTFFCADTAKKYLNC